MALLLKEKLLAGRSSVHGAEYQVYGELKKLTQVPTGLLSS